MIPRTLVAKCGVVVATSGLLSVACEKNTTEPTELFKLSPNNPSLLVSSSVKLTPNSSSATPVTAPVEWSSSAPNIVAVAEDGRITGMATGSAVIRATVPDGFGETTVTVIEGSEGIINAGIFTTCGIAASGDAYCWGYNKFGQLGAGTTGDPNPTPQKVLGNQSFNSVTGSTDINCGGTSNGTFCWGQLPTSSIQGTPTPVKIVGSESFVQVNANGASRENFCIDVLCDWHVYELTSAGEASAWGVTLNPTNGAGEFRLYPTKLATSQRFFSISAGFDYVCGVGVDAVGYCWGANILGETSGSVATTGIHTVNTPPLQAISAGRGHTCALSLDGDVYCWGANTYGQLGGAASETCHQGFYATSCTRSPIKVATSAKFVAISVGPGNEGKRDLPPDAHTCGLTTDLKILCWGNNKYGQNGNGSTSTEVAQTPTEVASGLKWRSVSAGRLHTCAVAIDGSGWCWGWNGFGQLGDGTKTNSSVPVRVSQVATFK